MGDVPKEGQGFYRLFGLTVASDLELPELGMPLADCAEDRPDVTITLGKTSLSLDNGTQVHSYFEFTDTACLVDVEKIARFEIRNGCDIKVEPCAGAAANDIRAYLFGTGFAALLHQRKCLPLHLSAVKSPKGVIAFTGASGAGKSTFAGLLCKRSGWPMICDDLAVVEPNDKTWRLHGGMLRLKLWGDAIERLSVQAEVHARDTTRDDKYHLISPHMFVTDPEPMAALFTLKRSDQIRILPVSGADKFASVMNTIYRPELVNIFSDHPLIMKTCAALAEDIDVYCFERPWDVAQMNKGVDAVIELVSVL